ncbi:XrtA system polysaccharide deacetylase (plasmid) [Tundrisphaera lichenicola]|uniref:XrtA system polysaccharide deacetylase n=1 Tax=Tundrisphaera lichenicola TaxID=2029860 RepID=UPI003EBF7089
MHTSSEVPEDVTARGRCPVVLSFDVEAHHEIEAAARLRIDPEVVSRHRGRVAPATRWILDQLAEGGRRATFFIVGQIARSDAALVREIHDAGHEVASHGWNHRRIQTMNPAEFREDLRRSKDALEQVTGEAVVGYRAPTFSVVPKTAWALDAMAELGFVYDSSIYPIHHDRYGVPDAPRTPFLASGHRHQILELPPATCRLLGVNVPVGGGGYFRLLPSAIMLPAIDHAGRTCDPSPVVLYFHPWEFDPAQPRLPLPLLSRFRTYVGIRRSRGRLVRLLELHPAIRAIDEARRLAGQLTMLPQFSLVADNRVVSAPDSDSISVDSPDSGELDLHPFEPSPRWSPDPLAPGHGPAYREAAPSTRLDPR